MNILGISAYYHDSAAALIKNGDIVACAQEERFTRIKHDARFPQKAIQYCLQAGHSTIEEIDYVVFYEKPLLTFERLIETYLTFAPQGFSSFLKAMPIWLKDKLFLKKNIKKELSLLSATKKKINTPLLFTTHHQSHAASAFFPSPFNEAAVLCLDGVGEWATTSVWLGKENQLIPKWEIKFPHSLGLLYSAFTYFTGFKVNSGEYKLMGLAPYGEPVYVDLILEKLINIKDDGTYRLNMQYFDFATQLKMTGKRFENLFGRPARSSESEITQQDMDIARSIQVITEEIVVKLAKTIRQELNVENLCLAGGVALNCVANGKIAQEKIFNNIWIQPAAGDAGGALGAALSVWHEYLKNPRIIHQTDSMKGSYLGPHYSNEEIKTFLDREGAQYTLLSDEQLFQYTTELLKKQKVIGWFQGRMEFGPRALGNRSIIGDARSQKMQSLMNLKIKFRESFRPFAPAVLNEKKSDWFDLKSPSPYMLLISQVNHSKFTSFTEDRLSGLDKLKIARTFIPAVTHVDYSARIQTVHAETNPRFHRLISTFEKLTTCPVIINTSFNVRGEPIVCTPEDAFRCFMSTKIDCLIMENIVLLKEDQPAFLMAAFKEGETVVMD
jgi:carbamoyltransferase